MCRATPRPSPTLHRPDQAFDTVNPMALWSVLHKLGCQPKYIQIICIHFTKACLGMHHRIWCGLGSFPCDHLVWKQGCVLAPILFSLLFAQMLDSALSQSTVGVNIHYQYDGDFFNLHRLQSRIKVSHVTVRDFLFADDCALAAHSEKDLQELANCFPSASKAFGLTVSIKKTEVLRQLAPNTTRCPPNTIMDGEALKNVDVFKYLGSSINTAANLDDEVLNHLSKASQAFGHLHTLVWQERSIRVNIKLDFYKAVVLSSLLYGCETWTCYRHHIKKLEQFHLRCLRKILHVGWDANIPNQEILCCTKMLSIETHLKKAQFR